MRSPSDAGCGLSKPAASDFAAPAVAAIFSGALPASSSPGSIASSQLSSTKMNTSRIASTVAEVVSVSSQLT